MDPIAQILAQSQAGSAGGEGFGQFFAEGVRQAQQQQGLNLSRRRLEFEEEREKRREPMLELQRMAALQQLALGSLELQKTQSDNSYAISLRNADLEISKFMSALAQSGKWGSPESWQAWNQITSRVPLAAVSKSGQLFLQQQRLAMANQRLAEQYGGRPAEVEIATPEGGKAKFGRTVFAPSETIKNLQALSEAEAAGDQNAISALRQKLNLGGLSQTDIIKFRSELRELESNILLPDDEKAKRREEIYRKYSAPSPATPTPSERRIKVTRPDGTTGTVPESRVKDLPPDWKTELDKG